MRPFPPTLLPPQEHGRPGSAVPTAQTTPVAIPCSCARRSPAGRASPTRRQPTMRRSPRVDQCRLYPLCSDLSSARFAARLPPALLPAQEHEWAGAASLHARVATSCSCTGRSAVGISPAARGGQEYRGPRSFFPAARPAPPHIATPPGRSDARASSPRRSPPADRTPARRRRHSPRPSPHRSAGRRRGSPG